MKSIYLDHAATAFPKAPGVVDAISDYLLNNGASVGRGLSEKAFSAEHIVFDTRERLSTLFNFPHPNHVIFTKNITESLNVLIKGLLTQGDHVIVSSMEHNAVMRPLNALAASNISFSKASCSNKGTLDFESLKTHLKPETKAVIMTHASNVCGSIQDLKQVGEFCKENKLLFIVDAAQTAGFTSVDFQALNAHAIAFTGHKSLLGPQGIGGFLIDKALASQMRTFIEGGTGSLSDQEIQPEYMPDKFEAGTPNLPGIFGLNAALKYIEETSIESIRSHELALTGRFLEGLSTMSTVKIIGKQDLVNRTGVVSIDLPKHDNAEISYRLYKEYGIATRCGMHCAPSAHETLGTFPQGTVRFSFSHFNTIMEVDTALKALQKLLRP